MKRILILGLALLLPIGASAQTTTALVYREGGAVVDSAGNLVVIEEGRSATGVTVTGMRHSFYARVTVQHPESSGNTQTVSYDADVRVIGAGDSAIYAIATVYTVSASTVTAASSLIAIKAGQSLPAALSGFPTLALTSDVDARVGPSDYIALVTEPASQSTTATTATTRTATVVHFNGTSFETVSSGTLP